MFGFVNKCSQFCAKFKKALKYQSLVASTNHFQNKFFYNLTSMFVQKPETEATQIVVNRPAVERSFKTTAIHAKTKPNHHEVNPIISSAKAQEMAMRWHDRVATGEDLSPLFWLENGEYITGIELVEKEYFNLISPVDIALYKIRFGLCEQNKFHIIIAGFNPKNEIVTPIYALNSYATRSFADVKFTYSSFVPNCVAPKVAQKWVSDWDKAGKIPAKFFSVYGQPLNGFTASYLNFSTLLLEQSLESKVSVNIMLTLHRSEENATASLATIGIHEGTGFVSNRMHPCPYTCANGGDDDWWSWIWPF
jgi:hypothetical protein